MLAPRLCLWFNDRAMGTCDRKNELYAFLEAAENYVVGCENASRLNDLFIAASNGKERGDAFMAALPEIKKALKEDLEFFLESDPAADSKEEIVACYPGYRAIRVYRIAHALYLEGYKVEARILSERAHALTGIDIHPAATIGAPFFIDHGTGVVIGATAIIGHHTKLYQGVTLGALSLKDGRKMASLKRHPTIGNYVTIYSNATILGGDVSVGDYVTIGANVTIVESIPDHVEIRLAKTDLVMKKVK